MADLTIGEKLARLDASIGAMEDRYDCRRDEDGFTPRELDEIWGAQHEEQEAHERRALRQLWAPEIQRKQGWGELLSDDWAWPWWLRGRRFAPMRRLMTRICVSTAIIRGRWGTPPGDRYGVTVCWWDYSNDGYFWGDWSLRYHRGGWVSVEHDGDGESPY